MYIDKAYILSNISEERLNILTEGVDSRIDDKVADASDLIDNHIKNVVTLPLEENQVPKTIKRICYDITMYYLHDRVDYADVPEAIETKYKEALKLLNGISSGKINLNTVEEDNKNDLIDYGSSATQFKRNSY